MKLHLYEFIGIESDLITSLKIIRVIICSENVGLSECPSNGL